MSPCESCGRIVRSRSKNMNHCGQSPSGFCWLNTRSRRSRTGSLRPSAYYAADYVAYPVSTQAAEKAAPIAAPGLPT